MPFLDGSISETPESPFLSDAINNLAKAVSASAPKTEKKSAWTSLEIAKLIVSGLTPILVLIFGIGITRSNDRHKTVIDERIKSYDRIKEDLNRIHCFITDVGTWKEETPQTVVSYKRIVDREMYEEQGIWSKNTMQAYLAYMDAAFATNQGSGIDAKINATLSQKRNSPKWSDDWQTKITGQEADNYQDAYNKMYQAFFNDMK